VTLKAAKAKVLAAQLEKEGIKTDARGEYLRLCPDFLNREQELAAVAAVLAALIKREDA
jgi:kynureninase